MIEARLHQGAEAVQFFHVMTKKEWRLAGSNAKFLAPRLELVMPSQNLPRLVRKVLQVSKLALVEADQNENAKAKHASRSLLSPSLNFSLS